MRLNYQISRRTHRLLTLLFFGILATGCAGTANVDQTATAEEMYREGVRRLYDIGNYSGAVEQFQGLQARYPFGDYATQAHLELIYAHYLLEEPEMAAEEADRFILENPRHPAVDYAYYMKGLAYFSGLEPNALEDWFDIDPATKSAEYAKLAFQNFQQMLKAYPDSQYADDARQRMLFLRNFLARHEYYTADYYYRRGAYVAAINRAQRVVENYPTTPAAPHALALISRSYRLMDMPELAADTEKTFRASYPGLTLDATLKSPVEKDEDWF